MAIVLPNDIEEITAESMKTLKVGHNLSKRCRLDLLTGGPRDPGHYPLNIALGSDILYEDPLTQFEIDDINKSGTDIVGARWQIISNLQHLAVDVMERLIFEYDRDLHVHKGYMSPRTHGHNYIAADFDKHYTGEAVDIQIKGNQQNMYGMVSEICGMLDGKCTEVGLIFSQKSWLHIGINGPHGPDVGKVSEPQFYTIDMVRNHRYEGIYPARGFYNNF